MKINLYLLISVLVLTACKKTSSDGSPTPTIIGTDQGYGSLTFKGKTYYFQGYSYVPTTNLGSAAGTVVADTTAYTVSMNLTPRPVTDTTYHMAPQTQGALVYLMQTSTTSSGYSRFYYFEKPTDTLHFALPAGKRSFTVTNLTETDQFGVPINSGETLTAILKQK